MRLPALCFKGQKAQTQRAPLLYPSRSLPGPRRTASDTKPTPTIYTYHNAPAPQGRFSFLLPPFRAATALVGNGRLSMKGAPPPATPCAPQVPFQLCLRKVTGPGRSADADFAALYWEPLSLSGRTSKASSLSIVRRTAISFLRPRQGRYGACSGRSTSRGCR